MRIGEGVAGALTDFVVVPYDFGTNSILAHLNTAYYHIHGQSFVYPNHADDVLITAGAPAWGVAGSIIEVIPANTLSVSAFDLHWLNISNISEIATIQIDIYKGGSGSEVLIGSTRASRSTNQTRNGPNRIQIPQQVKNERISCRLSSSTTNATTCLVSFEGHYYA
jgi:hypothetical protein